jgi:hypothetical protein
MSARRLVLVPVALIVLALAGVAAAAAPTDPQRTINPTDQAWADSIVLAREDLGKGWMIDPSSEGNSSDESSASWCPDGTPNQSDLTVTGSGASPDFTRTDSSYASSLAVVWHTSDEAQADWDRTVAAMPAFLDCLGELFKEAPAGVKVSVTSKAALPFAAVASRTAAYRIKLVIKSTRGPKKKRKKLVANYDMVLFGNGRASAWLFFVWFNGRPLSAAYEKSLAEKMVARMATDPAPATTP